MKQVLVVAAIATVAHGQIQFVDATEQVGLAELSAARVVLVDLDGDTRPDAVVNRTRVFLNRTNEDGSGVQFVEVDETGLPDVNAGDCVVFADLDNDGFRDAIVTRNVTDKTDPVLPTAWYAGLGDGTFGQEHIIVQAVPKTTACVAVGDVDGDGLLDLYLGNWYTKYGAGLEAFYNDLLLQQTDGSFTRWATQEDQYEFSAEHDRGGRPTYGAMIVRLVDSVHHDPHQFAQILELSYGRRANRLWWADRGLEQPMQDVAGMANLGGDDIRHGRYPDWLKERAKTDARFDRADELPFRANGNTFDAAIGDVDGDGRFDVLLSTIAHGWAGESSDRSRLMVQNVMPDPGRVAPFSQLIALNLDRIPSDPSIHSWNQGDLFCELADFDLDGRLDVLLSSGDYPDDQRLRVWRHLADGSFADVTNWSGFDNDGSQQITLGDVDLDGDIDILVGQTFNRMPKPKRAGRTPTLKVYLNQAIERSTGNALTLILEGEPSKGVSRDALGAIVQVEADLDGDAPGGSVTMLRQLIGIGGHAGKQHAFEVSFGLGGAAQTGSVTIWWPGAREPTVIDRLESGRHHIRQQE